MEDIERVTTTQIESLRKKIAEKIATEKAVFCAEDLERIKNDDLWLRRFIAATEQNVDEATRMLYETCQWRKEFGVNELVQDHTKLFPGMIEKGFLFIRNKDNWGKDILVFKGKNHTKGIVDIDEVKKLTVYWLERAERLAKSDQISVIYDMKDTGWSNLDMDFVRYFIILLKQYYPYFVNYLLIFEIPWLLKSAWSIIKTWLPPKFVERVKFLDKKTITEYINSDNCLTEWGGNDSYSFTFEPLSTVKSVEPVKKTAIKNSGIPSSPADSRKANLYFEDQDQNGAIHMHDIELSDEGSATPRRSPSPPDDETIPPSTTLRRAITLSDDGSLLAVNLIQASDTIEFDFDGHEYAGSIKLTNITSQNVIFKIKTTTPQAYRVKPTIGLLNGGTHLTAHVYTSDDIDVRNHRFQVIAAILPHDIDIASSSEEMDAQFFSYPRLNTLWKKNIERRVPTQSVRIRCVVNTTNNNTSLTNVAHGAGCITMNEESLRKGLDDLERKLSANMHTMLEAKLKKNQLLMWFLIGLVAFLGLLIYTTMPGTVQGQSIVPTGECSCPTVSSHPHLPDSCVMK